MTCSQAFGLSEFGHLVGDWLAVEEIDGICPAGPYSRSDLLADRRLKPAAWARWAPTTEPPSFRSNWGCPLFWAHARFRFVVLTTPRFLPH